MLIPDPDKAGFTFVELLMVMLVIGAIAALAVPRIRGAQDHARVAQAITDIRAVQVELASLDSLPPSLAAVGRGGMKDPWGNPYVYVLFESGGSPRTDRFGVPLNTLYDLYSTGSDGNTAASLSTAVSRDDVVRGAEGGFIGLGSTY